MAVWTTNNALTPCIGENDPIDSPMKKTKQEKGLKTYAKNVT